VFTTLSFVAATTDTVGLVSAVALASLYPPALRAKLVASLDLLSDHRFVLGSASEVRVSSIGHRDSLT
jgi:alkanesulfonate monooxygenase SsuD/methylene tetrahydromethanopterin reductase-like flavin-dependent oxidoreductase (luciferase family)